MGRLNPAASRLYDDARRKMIAAGYMPGIGTPRARRRLEAFNAWLDADLEWQAANPPPRNIRTGGIATGEIAAKARLCGLSTRRLAQMVGLDPNTLNMRIHNGVGSEERLGAWVDALHAARTARGEPFIRPLRAAAEKARPARASVRAAVAAYRAVDFSGQNLPDWH